MTVKTGDIRRLEDFGLVAVLAAWSDYAIVCTAGSLVADASTTREVVATKQETGLAYDIVLLNDAQAAVHASRLDDTLVARLSIDHTFVAYMAACLPTTEVQKLAAQYNVRLGDIEPQRGDNLWWKRNIAATKLNLATRREETA